MSSVTSIPQTRSIFRPTDPSDLARITDLLARAFKTSPTAPYVNPLLMNWKYWEPREDWAGPRSYVLERNNVLVAHAGIWPVTLLNDRGERVTGIHMIDWAAAENSPGAGIALIQKLAGIFDFIFCIGGSDVAQKVLPTVGFITHTRTLRGARPLRAIRQILSHPDRSWKLPPRLVRNFLWSVYPRVAPKSGWNSLPIAAEQSADLLNTISSAKHFLPRSPGFFEYLLRCPGAALQLHMVHDPNGPRGVFALSRVGRQIRLAGLWLRDPDNECWTQAYILAQRAAAKIADACEFAASTSQGASGNAATASGLRVWSGPAVYLLDKNRIVSGDFQFQLCDNDAFFSNSGRVSYWT
jgi:hypothetical protein